MAAEMHFMVGMPGSGKSTAAEAIRRLDVVDLIINPDSIREEMLRGKNTPDPYFDASIEPQVWAKTKAQIRKALKRGERVLLDSTNLVPDNWKRWKKYGEEFDAPVIAHVIETPYEECYIRNLGRERVVPTEVMEKMHGDWKRFCFPSYLKNQADYFGITVRWYTP